MPQLHAGVAVPIPVDLRMAGVVEAWASGCAWEEVRGFRDVAGWGGGARPGVCTHPPAPPLCHPQVMRDCSLDDGDVARLLTRTADLLRQVACCEHLLPPLRAAARRAKAGMERSPISDLVV